MAARYVIAIDAGTSGVHCLLTDLEGHVRASSHEDWSYETPPDAPLGREFRPALFWRIIAQNIRKVVNRSRVAPCDIAGVSATSQREGAVFLNSKGRELYAAPNIDLRAVAEGMSIDADFGPQVYSITGHAPSLLFVPAKLRWFQANRPRLYTEVCTALTLGDWIVYKLCGEVISEPCGANELGLVDVRTGMWSRQLAELLNLPGGILPPLATPGQRVGTVSAQAAEETGVPRGVAVAAGAPDTQCGLLGMGVKEAGRIGVVMGWSAPVQMATDSPILDVSGRTWTSRQGLPGKWVLESNVGEAGNAYHWLAEIMFGMKGSSQEDIYAAMDRLSLQAPAGCDGVLARIGPDLMDVSQPGLKLGGMLFHVPLSASLVQRSHLARAAIENLCFAVKANYLQTETISGMKALDIGIGGGLARSQTLCQLLPQVLDMPVRVADTTEVSALGAAMCAAAEAGAYSSLEEAATAMQSQTRTVEPDPLAVLEYADHYQRWASAGKWLDRMNEELH